MMKLQISNEKDIAQIFYDRGYKKDFARLDKSSFNFPPRADELIQDFYIISDYGSFQIYLAKVPSMRRTDFRIILEPFYRRYPHINTLFVFTKDFSEIALVSPTFYGGIKSKLFLRTLFIDPSNVYHTDLEVLEIIKVGPDEQDPNKIWQKHNEAFNIERVTTDFFNAYKNALNYIKEILIEQKKADSNKCHSFAQQLLSRIMFLYYIQKKGWLKWKDYQQDRYIRNLWEKYKKWKNDDRGKKDKFYSLWLSNLFFSAFNKNFNKKKYDYLKSELPEEIKESFNLMPFLNGGLFTPNELDEIDFHIPDSVFELLFDIDPQDPQNKNKGFLERFNFTVREDTALDVEVAVDPEMLGKVYESLIAEEERGEAGIFYTPRIEIDFMCRMSLVEHLVNETKIKKDKIIDFVFDPHNSISSFTKDELRLIKQKLDDVKVVDPAVGSASFLVGMMNILVELHQEITKALENREENLFALKHKIILENLYGVDVKDWAVMVGELRLWLSLIIETDEKYMDIYTKPLLPNLSFKIRQGDSLIQEIAGIQINLKSEMLHISGSIRDKIRELVERKSAFFSGLRSADLKEIREIEKLENEIFKEILNEKISRLKERENKLSADLKLLEKGEIPKGYPVQWSLFER